MYTSRINPIHKNDIILKKFKKILTLRNIRPTLLMYNFLKRGGTLY